MKPEIIAIISAVGGILVGTIGNIIISFISKELEYKKEIKKLIMEISLAEWKERTNVALKSSGTARIYPLMQYYIANSNIIRLVGGRKTISVDKVSKIFDHNLKIRKLIDNYTNKVRDDKSSG